MSMNVTGRPRPDRPRIAEELRAAGFRRSPVDSYLPGVLVAGVVVAAALTWLALGRMQAPGQPGGAEVATAVLGLGAFLVAFQQWRAARKEATLEKYYERLDVANRRKEVLDGVDHFDMYVFAELDNLEYVIEKYKLGYISPEQAFRGLRAFRSRCEHPDFRERALRWVGRAGYMEDTEGVVRAAAP